MLSREPRGPGIRVPRWDGRWSQRRAGRRTGGRTGRWAQRMTITADVVN